MAHIYRPKSRKVWMVVYTVSGIRYRRSLGTRNRKVAKEKLKDYLYREAFNALPPEQKKIELRPLLERYGAHLRATRKKKSAEADLGRLAKFFEAVPIKHLGQLTAGMVQGYLNKRVLAEEIAGKTANEYRQILHAMFEYAIRYEDFYSEKLLHGLEPK